MKKLLSLFLGLCLFLTPFGSASAQEGAHTYTPGQFSDVSEDAWYGDGGQKIIRGVFESGLMLGRSDGLFGIDENVKLAECVAMAARVCALSSGENGRFQQGSPWYAVYFDYAEAHGILAPGEFPDPERNATRAEVALLFYRALPESAYPAINVVEHLPDVRVSDRYAEEIFQLYRAGVLTGSDDDGTFWPDSAITRQEAAAILLRAADESRRLKLPDKPGLFSFNGFIWDRDYTHGMRIAGYESWHDVAWAAYYSLVPGYSVTLCDAVFDFQRFSSFLQSSYNTITFYCSVPNRGSLIEVRQQFGSFDYQNAALRNRRVLPLLPAEERQLYETLDSIAASCIADGYSEREKAKALHDYMVRQYDYDPGAAAGGDALFGSESFSYRGLLKNGYGVCQAYMELFYLLCTRVGLDCGIVTGSADGGNGWGSHGWNVLRFRGDDTPYYVDVTFDDPIGGDGSVFYDYFLVTADRLSADHAW